MRCWHLQSPGLINSEESTFKQGSTTCVNHLNDHVFAQETKESEMNTGSLDSEPPAHGNASALSSRVTPTKPIQFALSEGRQATRPCQTETSRTSIMFFSQDPMLLYQQSPYMPSPSIPRSPANRPSFLIDDLLVTRQSPYLMPKQAQDHGSQLPPGSNSSFKFAGMPALMPRSREDHSPMYQGKISNKKIRTLLLFCSGIARSN